MAYCRARDLLRVGRRGDGIEIADYLAINLVVFDVGERLVWALVAPGPTGLTTLPAPTAARLGVYKFCIVDEFFSSFFFFPPLLLPFFLFFCFERGGERRRVKEGRLDFLSGDF